MPLGYFIWSLFFGERAANDPWNGSGLEWRTTVPPPWDNCFGHPAVLGKPYSYRPEGAEPVHDQPRMPSRGSLT
ncbi:hypothetical protein [Methylobacterium sp. PvR107]|uniref:hypothetical protein n=1 Tax=Methylobacterium sp. PvR107 TaxID=2806597 RepID=UPI001B402BEF|nr:heme/copper-type cytochrome/quinol oxidase subunit 1 [Methylobacterium sp. PvR107]